MGTFFYLTRFYNLVQLDDKMVIKRLTKRHINHIFWNLKIKMIKIINLHTEFVLIIQNLKYFHFNHLRIRNQTKFWASIWRAWINLVWKQIATGTVDFHKIQSVSGFSCAKNCFVNLKKKLYRDRTHLNFISRLQNSKK